MQKSMKKWFPLFVLPTLVAFLIAFAIPFVMGVYLSFTKFTNVLNANFIGIGNYVKAFADPKFVNSLAFTVGFTIVSIITVNILAFFLALALTRDIKGTNIFRTIFFMPNLIGGIVLGNLFVSIFTAILEPFVLTLTSDPALGFWGLVILMNWQMVGYMMIIYIAGIQNISPDLIEAAQIDGATRRQTLFRVKIPMVMPSITICLFLTISNSFKLFDQNLALTGGAPADKSAMLALNIYNTIYGRVGWAGVGQAKAVIFFLIVAAITFMQLYLTRSKEVEN